MYFGYITGCRVTAQRKVRQVGGTEHEPHDDLEMVAGGSDLISLLSALVNSVENGADGSGVDALLRHDAAERALAAAAGVERRLALLSDQVRRLQKLVVTDELTGLLNRRGFESELNRTLALARRHDETGMILYVDLDGFKAINDTFGHAVGDEVLRHVASLLVQNIRSTDVIGRLGGDEFAIILTRASVVGGHSRARVLEALLNEAVLVVDGRTISIAASFGALPYRPGDEGPELLARADAKMYEQKRQRQLHSEGRKIA